MTRCHRNYTLLFHIVSLVRFSYQETLWLKGFTQKEVGMIGILATDILWLLGLMGQQFLHAG